MNQQEFQKEIDKLQSENALLKAKLGMIENSIGWRIVQKTQKIRRKALPLSLRKKLKVQYLLVMKGQHVLRKQGIRTALKKTKNFLFKKKNIVIKDYSSYLAARAEEVKNITEIDLKALHEKPLISIVIPTYKPNLDEFKACIKRVHQQIYTNYELIIVNDYSQDKELEDYIVSLSEKFPGFVYVDLQENHNISGSQNAGLEKVKGDFVLILDQDDELYPDALYQTVRYINNEPDVDYVYFDEDHIDKDGKKYNPFFKPDFSEDTLMSFMYMTHGVYRTEKLRSIGGFRKGYEGVQDWDACLRLVQASAKFGHIAKVLYSWRESAVSTADSIYKKPEVLELQKRIVNEHMHKRSIAGSAEEGIWAGSVRAKRNVATNGKVTIIIPTYNNWQTLDVCIQSIRKRTHYKNYEILIINNNSNEEETFNYFKNCGEKVLDLPIPFNFSKINNEAFKTIDSEYVLFMNNDMEVLTDEWLDAMLEHAQRPEVGIVCPKLLFPDNTIQHAGLVLGIGGIAGHGMKGVADDDNGYFGQANIIREVSGATGANILMRSEVFHEVGMFDEAYTIAFQDVDLSMKVRKAGYRIIYTPYAKLYHYESKTRGKIPAPVEYQDGGIFAHKWGSFDQLYDPFYNRNLTLEREDFSLR